MNNNTTVSPAEYFAEVKSRKQVMTEAGLSKLYENCLTLLDEYQRSGQIAAQKKLLFHIDNITREKKLLDVGIDTFVYKSDIDDFIHMVDNKVVKIVELENYQRRIPPEIIARIEKCKGIFDKMYVVFTDYTHREERRFALYKRNIVRNRLKYRVDACKPIGAFFKFRVHRIKFSQSVGFFRIASYRLKIFRTSGNFLR